MRAAFLSEPRRNALVVLLVVLASFLVISQYTGLISNIVTLGVNISSSTQGNVYIINASGPFIEGRTSGFSFALDNIGSRPLQGSIRVEIRDSSNLTVDQFDSDPYLVQPGSYVTYLTQWVVSPLAGNYTLYVWDNATDPTDMDQAAFSVFCEAAQYRCFGSERRICGLTSWDPVETCTYGCQDGACLAAPPGGSGGVSSGQGPSYEMGVDYEEVFRAVQGISYTYVIRVTNIGDAILTNVSLRAASDQIDVRIPEIIVTSLQPSQSTVFVIDLSVPMVDLGDYEVGWEVTSRETSESGSFVVRVVSSYDEYTNQQNCEDAIDRYFSILDGLDKDIRSAEIRGYDMTNTKELLAEAVEELEVLKTLRDNGLYDECSGNVDILRRMIEQTAMVYSIAISRPVSIIAYPWMEQLILVFTIMALVAVIVILVGWRKFREWLNKNRLYLPKKW